MKEWLSIVDTYPILHVISRIYLAVVSASSERFSSDQNAVSH